MGDTKVQRDERFSTTALAKSSPPRSHTGREFGRLIETQRAQILQSQQGTLASSQLASGKPSVPAHAVVSMAIANGMRLGNSRRSGGSRLSGTGESGLSDLESVASEGSGMVGGGLIGGDAFAGISDLAASGDRQAIMMLGQRAMVEMGQQFNMQYLLLQHMMQKDNREFTTMSNVLKARHEGAKSIIKNIA